MVFICIVKNKALQCKQLEVTLFVRRKCFYSADIEKYINSGE